MKTTLFATISAILLCTSQARAQAAHFTNFYRQTQYPSTATQIVWVDPTGYQPSVWPVTMGGSVFDLYTLDDRTSPPTSYLLASSFVGAYIPAATLVIHSEDTASTPLMTRVDKPFHLDITVEGLKDGQYDPDASKRVDFRRYVQSYGEGGNGVDIDPAQATLLTAYSIRQNGLQTLPYLSMVPGSPRSKVRGEERFTIYSLEDVRPDYRAPAAELASQTIQVWPVAYGSISGIANGDLLRFQVPQVTVTYNDLYPTTYDYHAQVYKGMPQLGTTGVKVVGSGAPPGPQSAPFEMTHRITSEALGKALTEDGIWTIELVMHTPFGFERIRDAAGNPCAVWFEVDRTIKVNAGVTTIE